MYSKTGTEVETRSLAMCRNGDGAFFYDTDFDFWSILVLAQVGGAATNLKLKLVGKFNAV